MSHSFAATIEKKREESSTEEDEIRKCEGSSTEEDVIIKFEGLSIEEDEIRKCEESFIDEEDRISQLPDELIHQILSLFDMSYAVRTSVLSKRWRYTWTTLPTINLDLFKDCYRYRDNDDNTKLVNKALRSRSNYIQRLHVNLPMEFDRAVHRWIRAALKAKVEDVCISYTGEEIQIPKGTFMSASMKKLTLVIPYTMIELPEVMKESESCLPSLEYLKLDYIPSAGEEDINLLISRCPVIEYLDLMLRDRGSYEDGIKIASPTLKHLKIRKPEGRISLSLYAPKLVSLIFESSSSYNVYLEDVSSLVTVKIVAKEVRKRNFYVDGGDDISADLTLQKTSLEVLCNVKCLTISVPLLEDILGLPQFIEKKQVAQQFDNLRDLELLQVDFSWSTSIFVIAFFLSMSPNIKSLEITNTNTRFRDWESASSQTNELKSELETVSVMFTLNKLEKVRIYNFEGSGIEMKFLEILLMKAGVLEKLYIFFKPVGLLAGSYVREKIIDGLFDLRKKSGFPNVTILLDIINTI